MAYIDSRSLSKAEQKKQIEEALNWAQQHKVFLPNHSKLVRKLKELTNSEIN